MKKIASLRQTQIRIAGSVVFLSCVLFVGTVLFDKYLYDRYLAEKAALTNVSFKAPKTRIKTPVASSPFKTASFGQNTLPETVPQIAKIKSKTISNALEQKTFQQDMLWLARCVLSETDRPHEMKYVGWVIRNRVETTYNGKSSYQAVVLDPFQFSAFNAGSGKRHKFMSLSQNSKYPNWDDAVQTATKVLHAPADQRPFEIKTRHFYSEQSMVGGRAPKWAREDKKVDLHNVELKRFRFYKGII